MLNQVGKEDVMEVVHESKGYKRYLTVWHRLIRYPNGSTVDWDVSGHTLSAPAYAIVLPFNAVEKTCTLIVEYAQGTNTMLYNLPAGAFDAAKHADLEECAMHELSEEAGLTGGRLIRLLPPGHKVSITCWISSLK